uniref:RNA polymerase, sigma-24 subunit, ECF subfamily n=1 Tax=Solibacter usitatus (strain Ellin6076) TaxID=234267 RepID=Q022J0_SOLUE
MPGETPSTSSAADVSWTDSQLVTECLSGNECAWTALIDKYKNLIFSIPIRRGFSRSDATDIFQEVAAQLLSELTRIRKPEALAAWLIQVTSNRCTRWQTLASREGGGTDEVLASSINRETAENLVLEAEREQALRSAVQLATPQCRQLIRMLFFENPPLPYQEVAAGLGIVTGSIGFVRRKCLDRLRSHLEEAGFR